MNERRVRREVVLWSVLGPILAVALWGVAAFQLCGVSGCGGGGFGRSYSPREVLLLLLLSGLAAAAGAARRWAAHRSRRLLVVALLLALVTPLLGGLVIGARIDGYPRSVSQETIDRDEQRARDRARERERLG